MSIFTKASNLLKGIGSYFNPTSNSGNNFWSTQGAQRLANTQKAIRQIFPNQKRQKVINYANSVKQRFNEGGGLKQYFLPTALTTPQTQKELNVAGKYLEYAGKKIQPPEMKGTHPLPLKATRFVASLPGTILESYGRTAQLLTTPEGRKTYAKGIKELFTTKPQANFDYALKTLNNPAVSSTLDLTDLLPGGILFGSLRSVGREGLEKLTKEGAEKLIKEGAEGSVKRGIIKNLEDRIDNLLGTGGAVTGNWKSDYHIRQRMINEASEMGAPKEVVDEVNKIQEALVNIRSNKKELVTNYPLRSNEPPVIKRSELSGRALGLSDEQLLSGKWGKSEDLGVAQREWLENQPVKVKGKVDWTSPKTINQFEKEMEMISRPVTQKVSWIDYLRTPDRVLRKIGMDQEAKALRGGWESYKMELPQAMDKIRSWFQQAPNPGSEKKIFDYLDGSLQKEALEDNELKVAGEIKEYLEKWADRLNLPKEKRISEYIPHIFERGDIELEFDPALAKMIEGKVPGSVYDPFLQQRTNMPEYVHDVWRALSAYTKRAVRKANLDPALDLVRKASENLDTESYKYVQRLTAGVNVRPTEVDNLLDNFIKSTPIKYKWTNRPTAFVTQKIRRWTYRGGLGLNIGSAVRNLTQSVNTYAKLGEKWTLTGAFNFFKNIRNLDELYNVGVLNDSFITDRSLSAVKPLMEKLDPKLFFFFEWAEKINRGIAYFGAKAKYLNQGVTEASAMQKAKDLVRDTQFTFGAVDSPVILQSDIAKTLLQFQSFNIKQLEFLTEMLKNKEWAGLFRYGISSLALVGILGKTLGYEIKDFIPFSGVLSGETKLGQTPVVQATSGLIKSAFKAPNDYGQIPEGNFIQRLLANKDFTGAAMTFIPGGSQIKKTYQGLKAYTQGESLTSGGNTKFKVEQTPGNLIKSVLLGQYYTNEGREYIKNLGVSKSEVLYKELKRLSPQEAANKVALMKQQNPTGYKAFIEYMKGKQLKVTVYEKRVKNLTVNDGKRARALVKKFNFLRTPQQKADYYKRMIELGVITDEIQKQLNAARQAGVLK